MTYDELIRRLDQWHRDKNGDDTVDYRKAVTKYSEETVELHKAIHKEDAENMCEEIGDVLFCLHRLCRALGTDLMTVAEHKLVEIESRLQRKQRQTV